MEVLYREAVAADAEALIEYTKKVGGETDNLSHGIEGVPCSVERQARFVEKFAKNSSDLMLVAECDGQIVANASLSRNRIARYNHRAELSITVLRDFWGQGIGSKLMEMLISFAKDTQASVVSLEVRADNERAIALYQKFGFEVVGLYKKFFKIGNKYHNALIMNLYL